MRTLILLVILAATLASCSDTTPEPKPPGAGSEAKVDQVAEDAETDTDGDGVNDLYDQDQGPTLQEENADGDSDLNCAYELGDFNESGDPAKGFRFVAGGTLSNTGNVGINVRVTYKWKLLGRQAKVIRKRYKVKAGKERDVNVTVPVSSDDIDAHQNASGDCSAKATIVSSFGKPPPE